MHILQCCTVLRIAHQVNSEQKCTALQFTVMWEEASEIHGVLGSQSIGTRPNDYDEDREDHESWCGQKSWWLYQSTKKQNYDGQVLRKMWYFMLAVVQDKNLKHTKQLWFRFPLCIYLCVFKLGIKFKDFSQMSHDRGFTFYNLKQLKLPDKSACILHLLWKTPPAIGLRLI